MLGLKIHDLTFQPFLGLQMAMGENRVIEEVWEEDNPILVPVDPASNLVLPRDPRVLIEWVMPSKRKISYFLVSARQKGTTKFVIPYKNKDRKILTIKIRGESLNIKEQQKFMDGIKKLPMDERIRRGKRYLSKGDELTRERDSVGKEDYYYRAMKNYEKAFLILETVELRDFNPDFQATFDESRDKRDVAKKDFEKQVKKVKGRFFEAYKRGNQEAARRELRILLKVIQDPNNVRYLRYKLYLEHLFD